MASYFFSKFRGDKPLITSNNILLNLDIINIKIIFFHHSCTLWYFLPRRIINRGAFAHLALRVTMTIRCLQSTSMPTWWSHHYWSRGYVCLITANFLPVEAYLIVMTLICLALLIIKLNLVTKSLSKLHSLTACHLPFLMSKWFSSTHNLFFSILTIVFNIFYFIFGKYIFFMKWIKQYRSTISAYHNIQ